MYILLFFLLLVGLLAAFGVTPKDILSAAKAKRRGAEGLETRKLQGRRSAKERAKSALEFNLTASGTELSTGGFIGLTAVLVVIGVAVGLYMNNPLLSIVAGVFCVCIPYQYLKFRAISYKSILQSQLETGLLPISNKYMQTNDLVGSIQACLSQLADPLRTILNEEIVLKSSLGLGLETCIIYAMRNVNNRYFTEWCECIMRCLKDRNQKIGLLPIVHRLTDLKRIQAKVDTATAMVWKDHLVMSIIAVGALPAIKLLNAEWYSFLQNTTFGKVIVAMTFIAVGLGTLYVLHVNKPVALEE